jgi:uncharacterized damage-inducible protein DinB
MNSREIRQLVAFNRWANQHFFDALSRLPAEQYARGLGSSHGGIHGTLAHIIGAEKAWLCRWLRQPDTTAADLRQIGSLADLRAYWQRVCTEMQEFLGTLNDQKLEETLTTTTLSGTSTPPYWQMIQHVVDHSSYHRGQLVTMLRQLGVQPPSTGLMRFYREAGV